MNTSADVATGIMELENPTVRNMSDTIQSSVSDDDIIKIEEPDLEDYQSGFALETPLADLHINAPIHANVPQTFDLEVEVEETDHRYREKSDPDFKSFVVFEEASENIQATDLKGKENESFNKIMNDLNEILYFEQSASVLENVNKQEQHLDKTQPDSNDNVPKYKDDAEFETEQPLSDGESENVTVPMYLDTEVEVIAELLDQHAEKTTDEAAKHAKEEPTDLDLESAVNHELEFDAKEPCMQNSDVLHGMHSKEDMYVDHGDACETGQISVCIEENNDISEFVDLETFGEKNNSDVLTYSREKVIYKSIDSAADSNDSKTGMVDYNPEPCTTEFGSINSETEFERGDMVENEFDEKRNDGTLNNLHFKPTPDIEFKEDLSNTFVEHVPSQPPVKEIGLVASEPENLHLYAGSDSMPDQASEIEDMTRERHFGSYNMDEDDILFRGDEDVKDLHMYDGAFAAKGNDHVTGTENIDSKETPVNKTRELSDNNLNVFESGKEFEYRMLSEMQMEEKTRKEPSKNKPLPAVRSRVKESDRKGPFQIRKHTDDTEHLAQGAHAFPESDDTSVDDEYFRNMSSAMEKFVFFWKREDTFSQWHFALFQADGHLFSNAEQYMMFMKAELFGDSDVATEILNTTDPRAINTLGRKVKNFSESIWIEQCLYVVKNGNKQKFRQNDRMKKELFATHPKILVEANPHDQIWGIGLADCDACAFKESSWNGLNLLGYILTEVRDELMCEEGRISQDQKQVFLENMKVAYRNAMMFNDQSEAGN